MDIYSELGRMRQVRDALLVRIRSLQQGELLQPVEMKDYHGFSKSRFPIEWLNATLQEFGLTADEVQAELVCVTTNLRHEVHVHHEANAAVSILGTAEHLPDPVKASGYLKDHWFPVKAGDEVDIPAETPHGFTVEDDGQVYFLSVQSPPIEREAGHDDYERVPEIRSAQVRLTNREGIVFSGQSRFEIRISSRPTAIEYVKWFATTYAYPEMVTITGYDALVIKSNPHSLKQSTVNEFTFTASELNSEATLSKLEAFVNQADKMTFIEIAFARKELDSILIILSE